MGYILHEATITGYPSAVDARLGGRYAEDRAKADIALAKFRESMPDDKWRALVVGPVEGIINGYAWLAFMPDGSKEGWEDSNTGDRLRDEFVRLFGAAVTVRWGDEDAYVFEGARDESG